MVRAMIFDMDGVLIDSVGSGLRVRTQVLGMYGVDLSVVPDPQGEGHRAASVKSLLAAVREYTGIEIDQTVFTEQALVLGARDLAQLQAAVDPELITFLEELKQHRVACAIATSGQLGGVRNKLDILGIEQYFKVIVTGSEVSVHKPDPEVYLLTMERLGFGPLDCAVVEDSRTGVTAALAAGCRRVIGFTKYAPTTVLPGVALTVSKWSDLSYAKIAALKV